MQIEEEKIIKAKIGKNEKRVPSGEARQKRRFKAFFDGEKDEWLKERKRQYRVAAL